MEKGQHEILERGSKFLKEPEIVAQYDNETKAGMAAGSKEFALADFYIRKKLTAFGGIQDLIKDIDTKAPGINNIDKGNLPQGTFMALLSVGLGYALDVATGYATNNVAAGIRYASSEYLNTLPTGLVNSEFTLLSGNKPVLKCRTKKFFANAYADYAAEANHENAVHLPTPKLMDYRKKIKMQLEFPDGAAAISGGAGYVEVRLQGVMLIDRV